MVDSKDNQNSAEPSARPQVLVHVFGRTDVGMVRDHNEDNFIIADLSTRNRSIQPDVQHHCIGEYGSVFAVCDGMGGAAAGEVASQISVDTIYEMMEADTPPRDDEDLARRLDEAICDAGRRIHAEAKANASRRGMGTTATVAVIVGDRLIFGQVGDSRAHIVRNGILVQTTKDQSLVQQLIDANQLTVEEARNFDRSNIILQALGTSEEVHVDITSTVLRKGDVLVVCSDGLSGMVEPEDIRDVVLSIPNPIEACQKLTQMACDNGGDDNITVIVAKFDGEGLVAPKEDERVFYEKYMFAFSEGSEDITRSHRSSTPTKPPSFDRSKYSQDVEPPAKKLPLFIFLAAVAMAATVVVLSMFQKPEVIAVDSETVTMPRVRDSVLPGNGDRKGGDDVSKRSLGSESLVDEKIEGVAIGEDNSSAEEQMKAAEKIEDTSAPGPSDVSSAALTAQKKSLSADTSEKDRSPLIAKTSTKKVKTSRKNKGLKSKAASKEPKKRKIIRKWAKHDDDDDAEPKDANDSVATPTVEKNPY